MGRRLDSQLCPPLGTLCSAQPPSLSKATAQHCKKQGAPLADSREDEQKLVRKIDLCLLPMVWIMSLMSWMDRSNVGNATIAGMGSDLKMSSSRYSLVIVVFYCEFCFVFSGPLFQCAVPLRRL
ncbi:hypothetical protein B0T17DRAFT_305654 [Bombardia bombarda]|uniref:Uncharacterized protein n=1 Tax=Bombardia bombarda TaxID=252184 RepID=A0AA39WUG7_9PEZI|nr:hypothetical protein B0T17DRAFT_305654 [Bombardia bombarda]